MNNLFTIVCLLVCSVSLDAQITAVLNRSGTGLPEVTIRNNSRANLTAFAVSLSPLATDAQESTPSVFYADLAVEPDNGPHSPDMFTRSCQGQLPLISNRECSLRLPVGAPQGVGRQPQDILGEPVVIAGVFANGATTGDRALLSRLIMRRSNMLQALELAREILSEAGESNVPKSQLVQQFRQLRDSLNHWYLPQEQQVGRPLYESMIQKLVSLPALPMGSPFPPTSFVESERARLDQQRTVLLESEPTLSLALTPLEHR